MIQKIRFSLQEYLKQNVASNIRYMEKSISFDFGGTEMSFWTVKNNTW